MDRRLLLVPDHHACANVDPALFEGTLDHSRRIRVNPGMIFGIASNTVTAVLANHAERRATSQGQAEHCETLGGLRIGKNHVSPRWLQSPQRRLGLLQPPCKTRFLLDLA